MPELLYERPDFDAYIKGLVHPGSDGQIKVALRTKDEATLEGEKEDHLRSVGEDSTSTLVPATETESPFMTGLLADKSAAPSFDARDGKMLTENADVAYSTTGDALVDLFSELEDVISGDRLMKTLQAAWQADSEATLRIIWNARSIHLGKSSRTTFYRSVGWLAQNHPLTLLTNLQWLVRPIIPKKAPKKEEGKEHAEMINAKDADSDFELIDEISELEGQPDLKKMKLDHAEGYSEFDVKYGVAHGYWKDLLNILALAANQQLRVDGDVRSILKVEQEKKMYRRDWTEGKKKAVIEERYERATKKLDQVGFYKALYMSVARLFANQLKTDIALLKSGDKRQMKNITLAAKWAPSHKGMHDQHTFIVSTIAEMLHPLDSLATSDVDPGDRAAHLKLARSTLHDLTIAPLRKHLQIVERPITAEKFEGIKYDRVPSLAMQQYTPLFIKKDFDRFDKYLDQVAGGKSRISGATLMPSTLVKAVLDYRYDFGSADQGKRSAKDMVEQKQKDMQYKVIDGQWKTLCQRIKDSGSLESAIAVVDVSGSMESPTFPDGTRPMHSAIGLGLLLAEITKPPFGGAFITFSQSPQVMRAGGPSDERDFRDKVRYIQQSNWSQNTNFVAVFERLILPMAKENKLKPEDMVKQVFVFSDMQFDQANNHGDRWTTSYERIEKQFKKAGYEMPKLIFWNLAGGRAGYYGQPTGGNDTAPKPVTAAEENTVLVSGYSQAQMKMFLDKGSFEDPEEEEVVEDEGEGEDGAVVVEKRGKTQTPLDAVKKAISHEAYRMLKVVD